MIHLKRNTKRVKQEEKNNQLRKLKNIKVITILVLKKKSSSSNLTIVSTTPGAPRSIPSIQPPMEYQDDEDSYKIPPPPMGVKAPTPPPKIEISIGSGDEERGGLLKQIREGTMLKKKKK